MAGRRGGIGARATPAAWSERAAVPVMLACGARGLSSPRPQTVPRESVIPTPQPCPNCVEVPEPIGTIVCPVCQAVASLVAVMGERVTHSLKCPTCEGRQTACIFCYLPLGAADADRYAHAECSRRELLSLRAEGTGA